MLTSEVGISKSCHSISVKCSGYRDTGPTDPSIVHMLSAAPHLKRLDHIVPVAPLKVRPHLGIFLHKFPAHHHKAVGHCWGHVGDVLVVILEVVALDFCRHVPVEGVAKQHGIGLLYCFIAGWKIRENSLMKTNWQKLQNSKMAIGMKTFLKNCRLRHGRMWMPDTFFQVLLMCYKSQSCGLTSPSTARVKLGQVLSIATFGSRTHRQRR